VYFLGGKYEFTYFHDDGARLYVDDRLILDKWFVTRQEDAVTVSLFTGWHVVRAELFEHEGWASALLGWREVGGFQAFVPFALAKAGLPTPTFTPTPPPPPWILSGLSSIGVHSLAADEVSGFAFAGARGTEGVYRREERCGGAWVSRGLAGSERVVLALDEDGTLYAGTYGQGIWRSTDRGLSWEDRTGNLPARHILGATVTGLGEVFVSIALGERDSKVYRSADTGLNWDERNQGLPGGYRTVALFFDRFSGWLYAGTEGQGIYLSEDGGRQWIQVLGAGHSVWVFAQDPNNPILYAGTDQGVYKSLDGRTWTRTSLREATRAIAVDGYGIVYAGTEWRGVYRSGDQGRSWRPWSEGLGQVWVQSLAVDHACNLIYAGLRKEGVSPGGVWERLLP